MSDERLVAVTMFNHSRDIQGHWEGRLTKKELLRKVEKWWESHGTGLDDYDEIQVLFPFEREGNDV